MKAWDKIIKHMLTRQAKGYYPKVMYDSLIRLNKDKPKGEEIVSPQDTQYIKSCRKRNSQYKKPLTDKQRVIMRRILERYEDFVRD